MAAQRDSMAMDSSYQLGPSSSRSINIPPAPPPKPNEASRRGTPQSSVFQSHPHPPNSTQFDIHQQTHPQTQDHPSSQIGWLGSSQNMNLPEHDGQDPGEQWLPKILEDKSFVVSPNALGSN
jgi:hypothetical protein